MSAVVAMPYPRPQVGVVVFGIDGVVKPFNERRDERASWQTLSAIQSIRKAGWKVCITTNSDMQRARRVMLLADKAGSPLSNSFIDGIFASGGREFRWVGDKKIIRSPAIQQNIPSLRTFFRPYEQRLKAIQDISSHLQVIHKAGIVEVDYSWCEHKDIITVQTIVEEMVQKVAEYFPDTIEINWPSSASTPTAIEFCAVPVQNGQRIKIDTGTAINSIVEKVHPDVLIFFCSDDVAGAQAVQALEGVLTAVVVVNSERTPNFEDSKSRPDLTVNRPLDESISRWGPPGIPPMLRRAMAERFPGIVLTSEPKPFALG